MKRLLLMIIAVMLSGCAATLPDKINLNPILENQPAGVYPPALDIFVDSKDDRFEKHVVTYSFKNEPSIMLFNQVAPQIMLAERLTDGLSQQGLTRVGRSTITVTIAIEEMMVTVTKTKSGLLYNSAARSRLRLTVNNNGSILTKDYNREASKETATKPDIPDLEAMLNVQLSDVIEKILGDGQVREAIRGKM
ncbi:MAG: YajG family lipoprotein [Desulfoprunum sp.]|nr:YajG family lipoprotein [Desulfoprunum sp.]